MDNFILFDLTNYTWFYWENVSYKVYGLCGKRTEVTDKLWGQLPPTAKLARWLEKLSDFDFNIAHIKGSTNYVADA